MRADLESVQVVALAGNRAERVESRLVGLGCALVRTLSNEHEATHALRADRPDALVFEAGVAGDGFLLRARREDPSCALIAWLPSASTATTADLFELGADEVVHEGMGQRELEARIAAVTRRARIRPSRPLELGALRIDDINGEADWDGHDLALTRREREVLHALAESAGRTVPREILYKRVWGYTMARGDRSVDVNVKRVRAKLAKHAASVLEIKTQPGTGYRLELSEQHGLIDEAVTVL
jgi:DNA-binding response OmpR family regulator